MNPTTIHCRAGGLLLGMLAVLAIGGCGIPATSSSVFAPRSEYNRQTSKRSYYYLSRPKATPRRMTPAPTSPRPAAPNMRHPRIRPRPTERPKPTDAFEDDSKEYDRHPSMWKQKLRVKYV